MSSRKKLLDRVLSGTADASIRFRDLMRLLRFMGFQEHVRGDHHIFHREGVIEIVNIQPKASYAKPYQVKQVREIILKYRLWESS